MKAFQLKFQNHHERLANCYVTITVQAPDLSHLTPRIKKELKTFNSLPNPKQHSDFYLTEIKEIEKHG
jgi:hypothetical protein